MGCSVMAQVRNNSNKAKNISPLTDTERIKQLEDLFTSGTSHPKLVGADGKEIPLPESIYQAFKEVVQALASGQGKRISVVVTDQEMSTQEAADVLNVSRPYLIKLLEQGQIPFTTVGKHRRIKAQDLETYKESRDSLRNKALSEMTGILQEEGFYD
jgi:excisionase family DNA binding protein